MNYWFTNDSDPVDWKLTFIQDGQSNNTAKTAQRAANMIRAIDPDILGVQEGPSREGELALFIKDYLADAAGQPLYQFFLSDSGGQQRVALLYKPGAVVSASLAPHPSITNLIDPWEADVDGDMLLEHDYRFTRNPLVVDVMLGSHALQVVVVHTKSSFVNNGSAMWLNLATRQDYVVAALKARRRNGTEGMRIREYLDSNLAATASRDFVVLGDLNDGPGLDYFEKRYLAHNVTDIILGSAYQREWMLTHAQHDVPVADRYTAVFDDSSRACRTRSYSSTTSCSRPASWPGADSGGSQAPAWFITPSTRPRCRPGAAGVTIGLRIIARYRCSSTTRAVLLVLDAESYPDANRPPQNIHASSQPFLSR